MSTQNLIPKYLLEQLPEFDDGKYEYKWGPFEVPLQPEFERWNIQQQEWCKTATGFPLFRRRIRWELILDPDDWQEGDEWSFVSDVIQWRTEALTPGLHFPQIIIRRKI